MKYYSSQKRERSFTLPELLVAISITVLIALFLVKIIDIVSHSIHLNSQKISADDQARTVFDRMSIDFQRMPKRRDMGYHFTNANVGTDFFRFVSRVNGVDGDRGVSLVGYQLQKNSKGNYSLYRAAHGYSWEDYGFMGFGKNGAPPNLLNLSSRLSIHDDDYELLAKSVFQVGIAFQYKYGWGFSNVPPMETREDKTSIPFVSIADIASIIVGLAIIDPQFQNLMTEQESDLLFSKMSRIPESALPISHWNTNLIHHFPEFREGLPQSCARAVRVYQRFFPIE